MDIDNKVCVCVCVCVRANTPILILLNVVFNTKIPMIEKYIYVFLNNFNNFF